MRMAVGVEIRSYTLSRIVDAHSLGMGYTWIINTGEDSVVVEESRCAD